MSHSFKRSPVVAYVEAPSNKQDKRRAHGALRVHFRSQQHAGEDLDLSLFDERNWAHAERSSFAKTGKHLVGVRVTRERDHLRVLAFPAWLKTERAAKISMSK